MNQFTKVIITVSAASLLLVGCDLKKEENTEAKPVHNFRLQLISKVCCLVIKEFNFASAGEAVLQVHKFSDKRIQGFYFGHPLDI